MLSSNQLITKIKTIRYSKDFPLIAGLSLALVGLLLFSAYTRLQLNSERVLSKSLSEKTKQISQELSVLKNQDQYKRNEELQAKITAIEKTYSKEVATYERIIDFKDQTKNARSYELLLAQSLNLLSQRNYASAEAILVQINNQLDAAGKSTIALPGNTNVAVNNQAPSSGYSRQKVKTEVGEFLVDIVAADLGSTRVIVDTASESDCRDNCPVLPLGDYVSRSGAFAGINGSYFCPASYPSCQGKTNSFDTLLMNKNKVYFNSDNSVYSTVPAVIFSGTSARFVGQSSQWGRDTGVDSVLANQPLLLSGGTVVFGGDEEIKRSTRGSRSFVGNKGTTAYIGVVQNANVAEVALVLKAFGLDNALNLDSGGSTALWSGGYKVGPGRNIPNALLFVRK